VHSPIANIPLCLSIILLLFVVGGRYSVYNQQQITTILQHLYHRAHPSTGLEIKRSQEIEIDQKRDRGPIDDDLLEQRN
jgi:hypothetical protein